MKKLLALTLILSLNSCFFYKKDGIEMKIKNDSSEPITNVEFTTTEKLEVIKINPVKSLYLRYGFKDSGETKTHFLMEREPNSWE